MFCCASKRTGKRDKRRGAPTVPEPATRDLLELDALDDFASLDLCSRVLGQHNEQAAVWRTLPPVQQSANPALLYS
eukprot:SAG11_NODE_13567_length_649_cov_1.305455_1_plen_75_part_01